MGVLIPVIQAYAKLSKIEDDPVIAYHIRKIAGHVCYGLEGRGKRYASKAAQGEYIKANKGMIHDRTSDEQKNFDFAAQKKGKVNGTFCYEHVLTNSMLIHLISKSTFSVDTIKQIIRRNYCEAWILRTENILLNNAHYKSFRGSTLKDALQKYRSVGIILINNKGLCVN